MINPYRDDRTANLVVEPYDLQFPNVAGAVAQFARSAQWHLYPSSGDEVVDRLAEWLNVPAKLTRVASGSTECIRELISTTLMTGLSAC